LESPSLIAIIESHRDASATNPLSISFALELDRDRLIMSEEATSQDAIMPAPAETRPEVTESMATAEKVEAPVEKTTSVDPIEPPKDVAPLPATEVALEQPVAPTPTEPEAEPLVEKGMIKSLFPTTI
jgi:hypothetical protein